MIDIKEIREIGEKIYLRDLSVKNLFKIYDYADIINPPKITLEKTQEVYDEIKKMIEEKNVKVIYDEKENC